MPVCGGSAGFAASRLSLAVSLACSVFCAQLASASASASATPSPLKRRIPSTLLQPAVKPDTRPMGALPLARGRRDYRLPPPPGIALIIPGALLANSGARDRASAGARAAHRLGSPCVSPHDRDFAISRDPE